MKKTPLLAGASRFAHLAGLGARTRAAEGEEDKQARRASDDERDEDMDDDADDEPRSKKGGKAKRAEDDGDEDKQAKRGAKASDEEDEDRTDAEDDEEPKARGRKSKRAEEDDDSDDDADDDKREMTGGSAVAAARRRERARCTAIFAHPVAAKNPELAASLAFDTTMTRNEAVAVMKGQAGRATAPDTHADRTSRNRDLGGTAPAPTGAQATRASWGASFERVGAAPRR